MNDKVCIRYIVSGRVQGVWFRDFTQKQAVQLGLKGWARNLPDGTVEVLACGESAKLQQLYALLQQGPPRAEVKDVVCETMPWQEHEQFVIMR